MRGVDAVRLGAQSWKWLGELRGDDEARLRCLDIRLYHENSTSGVEFNAKSLGLRAQLG